MDCMRCVVMAALFDDNNQKLNVNSNYRLVPTNADGSINVNPTVDNKNCEQDKYSILLDKISPNEKIDKYESYIWRIY